MEVDQEIVIIPVKDAELLEAYSIRQYTSTTTPNIQTPTVFLQRSQDQGGGNERATRKQIMKTGDQEVVIMDIVNTSTGQFEIN